MALTSEGPGAGARKGLLLAGGEGLGVWSLPRAGVDGLRALRQWACVDPGVLSVNTDSSIVVDEDRLVACAVTLRARYAYALRGDRAVVTFDLESCLGGEGGSCLESDELVVMDKPKYEAHAMVSHPHRNMIATAGNDGALRVFVP